ncbi:sugar-binding transcriptional regulator [Brachybacterium sp. YJGR34]|uniref:sugar-binding transcriptional regulator n=1 Tax=Brachybacterium sp. YJGR34 TaxID=2059911 RepID=UPI00130079C9|nr:sugar-binding domain-containing protein [Brachybacterium sp. YJGR34]
MDLQSQVLHAYVAVQHLGEGRPILEIAEEVSLSRFAVSRMIKRARELGLVEVRAALTNPLDISLSTQLAAQFSLRSALVVAVPGTTEEDVRQAIAAVTATFLEDTVADGDIIGVTPGRTLVEASRRVESLPMADVVQLTGVGTSRLEDGVEAVLRLGRAAGGETYPLYAPILADEQSARTLLAHPSLRRTVQRFRRISQAYLTIGGWPDASLLARQVADYGDLHLVEETVAEIGATLLDADGGVVEALGERLIGISPAELEAVPQRIALGGGAGKHDAVLAVLRSGLADVVITDVDSARYALGKDGAAG